MAPCTRGRSASGTRTEIGWLREIELLQKLHQPKRYTGIVRLMGYHLYSDPPDDAPVDDSADSQPEQPQSKKHKYVGYVLLPYLRGGNLRSRLYELDRYPAVTLSGDPSARSTGPGG